ncbi:MAG TPA: heme exporter protein CcmD [Paracoccaceae bacterium]|nr:heme exporter protein CcmD [Paracoccaceae bacterium]HMO72223.1 heme exporter protein CcmD [Paracoccaceae bacterium]
MMPDLGKYAGAVLGSYAVTLVLVAALVVLTLWRGARVRAALREVEGRQGKAVE